MPQILVDITVLAGADDKSGIQRVVRSILQALLDAPPPGFVVMPIRDAGGYYAYARRFMQQTDAVQAEINEDEPIHLSAADIFLGLDLAPNHVTQNAALYADFKRHGVQIFFVVYDLLPVLHTEVFLPGASQWFSRWLETISTAADGLICISRAVADDLGNWLEQNDPQRLDALQIGYFHLGADIEASQPTSGMTATDVEVLKRMAARPSFLMVGTLEPRKSHLQALHAFELLWESGADINLIIVGKQGWMVEALVEKLRNHPEKDRRLLWLERISDEMLLKLYAAASALLAPSIAEGFGLPLIESAIQGLPIIARDLPVFREVCNEHAFYFTGDTAAVLADAVRSWMALDVRQEAPQSATMPRLNWSQSAAQLLDVIVAGHWYRLSAGQPAEAIA